MRRIHSLVWRTAGTAWVRCADGTDCLFLQSRCTIRMLGTLVETPAHIPSQPISQPMNPDQNDKIFHAQHNTPSYAAASHAACAPALGVCARNERRTRARSVPLGCTDMYRPVVRGDWRPLLGCEERLQHGCRHTDGLWGAGWNGAAGKGVWVCDGLMCAWAEPRVCAVCP